MVGVLTYDNYRDILICMKGKKRGKCMRCRRDPAYVRGLCHDCYRTMARWVKAGKRTWEQLEEGGKCLASIKRGVK